MSARATQKAKTRISTKLGGTLLVIGASQFILAMLVGEAICSQNACGAKNIVGYSVATNAISDMGVGSSAYIFNSSVFLIGLFIVISGYIIFRCLKARLVFAFLELTGIGAMGVGLFPETTSPHGLFAMTAFVFGGLSAVAAYRLQKPPLNFISIALGLLTLASVVLLATGHDMSLGFGGMERMVVYPVLIWSAIFGGYLIGTSGITG